MAQWKLFDSIQIPNHALRRLAGEWSGAQYKCGDSTAISWQWAAEPRMYMARALKSVGADKYEAVWRVECRGDGPIKVFRIGVPLTDDDPGEQTIYQTWAALPEWMQDRIRALSMILGNPPTQWVDGVGRRMSNDVYWVVK